MKHALLHMQENGRSSTDIQYIFYFYFLKIVLFYIFFMWVLVLLLSYSMNATDMCISHTRLTGKKV